jgi:hypothetical protein
MNVCFQSFLSYHSLVLVSDNEYVIFVECLLLILLCFGEGLMSGDKIEFNRVIAGGGGLRLIGVNPRIKLN